MHPTSTLYFREGSSDKLYAARIEPRGDGFVVCVEYGRRNGAMQCGLKTPSPVPLERAMKVYDQIVAEKCRKGYTPCESGQPHVGVENAGRVSGVLPQLLNSVAENELDALLEHPQWGAQEKFDGERRLVLVENGAAIGINRRGLTVALPIELSFSVLEQLPRGRTIIDGELLSTTLCAFDLLAYDGHDLTTMPFLHRYELLEKVWERVPQLGRARLARTARDKRALLDNVERDRGEGIVLRQLSAPYSPGRPASGGSLLKHKLVESASCRVHGVNDRKRSVGIELIDTDTALWHDAGSVTIPPNHAVPEPGMVVEVQYLYATEGGKLYQPVYRGARSEIDVSECTRAQLKFKRQEA